jgi:hypothetical protein
MWHCVGLVRTDISKEHSTSIFMVLVTANVPSSLILSTLKVQDPRGATSQNKVFFRVLALLQLAQFCATDIARLPFCSIPFSSFSVHV